MGKRKYFKPKFEMCFKNGMIMTNFLVTLLTFMLSINVIFSCMNIISKHNFYEESLQDLIGLSQLSRYLILADEIKIENNCIHFKYLDKDMKVDVVNKNLIIQPGTQFVIVNIDYLNFYIENNLLYIEYKRNKNNFKMVITNV
ncbi:MAG: hypothetical protein MR601_08465 [Erysipelotrichaceae bacterium]|nr:hypothetical protein [Erysipelotrichaceae bacterium]